MKKLLSLTLLSVGFIASFSPLHAAVVRGAPVAARTVMPPIPVQNAQNIIMQVISGNPDFAAELNTINAFIGTTPIILGTSAAPAGYVSYNYILQKIEQSTNSDQAIEIIEILEKAIMHKYHYDNYLVGSYTPGLSIFFSGIKNSYLNPFAWFSSESAASAALLSELEYLGKIASPHSGITSQRIALTVESYRHWKRNLVLLAAAYLSADAMGRGLQDSSLHTLYEQGLSGTPTLARKCGQNAFSTSKVGVKMAQWAAQKGYNFSQPIVKAICYGASGFEPVPTITDVARAAGSAATQAATVATQTATKVATQATTPVIIEVATQTAHHVTDQIATNIQPQETAQPAADTKTPETAQPASN